MLHLILLVEILNTYGVYPSTYFTCQKGIVLHLCATLLFTVLYPCY